MPSPKALTHFLVGLAAVRGFDVILKGELWQLQVLVILHWIVVPGQRQL